MSFDTAPETERDAFIAQVMKDESGRPFIIVREYVMLHLDA